MARNRFFEDETIDRPFNMKHFKRVLGYTKAYKSNFIITLALMAVITVLSLSGPYITKIIVDDFIPSKDIKGILLIISGFFAITAAQVALTTVRVRIMTKTGHSIIYDIRKEIFENLQRLSFNYFDNRPTGKILVRVTSYVDSLAGLLSDGIINVIIDFLTLFVIIGLMFTINVKLTFVSLVTCIPLMVLIFIFHKAMRKKWRTVNNKISNRTAFTHENIMGAKVVQAFVREQENADINIDLNQKVGNSWMSAIKINNLFWPGIDSIGVAGTIFTYLLGYKLIAANEISVGTLIAFTSYIGRFWGPLNNMSALYNQLLNAMANTERIFETIDEKPDLEDSKDAYELPQIKGAVKFNNVAFSYDGKIEVLSNVNFNVREGESIALVGPTGAGKSSIINLISRFYDVKSGSVLIDGIDVRDVKLKSLRKQMGIMLQDTFVFAGTIMENIRYGRLDATDDEVRAAAEAVYADRFIVRLKDGYNTVVDERGSSLSTGERQLLSFARTILADPRIIILDEATSNIDTKTELHIQKALENLLKGRTSFIIAHRLSTIKKADRVMYISNGTVLEAGTHDELMALGGEYHNLYSSQFSFINHG